MKKNVQQNEFLQALQQRIDRYKPLLEQQFDVVLGDVVAAPLRPKEWFAHIYAKSDRELFAAAMSKHGRPPSAFRRGLHSLEKLFFVVTRTGLISRPPEVSRLLPEMARGNTSSLGVV